MRHRKIVEMIDENLPAGYTRGERMEVMQNPTPHRGYYVLRSRRMERNITVTPRHVDATREY